MQVTPNPEEVQLIMPLDGIFLEHFSEQAKKEQERARKKK